MLPFFRDIPDNPFLLPGLIAGLLASVCCGVIGPLVITRRIVFLAGAVAHTALAGVGAVIYLHHAAPATADWLHPTHGGLAVALASAVAVAWMHHRQWSQLDTLIGAMWAVGVAAGVMLVRLTPGYHPELMSYLFGNISYVNTADAALLGLLAAILLAVTALYYKQFLAVCLDREQARLQGVNVALVDVVMLCLVALTVISLMQIVGLVLVLALLTLPAASAAVFSNRLATRMALAAALYALATTLPRVAVYGSPLSPESAIVFAAAAVYLIALAGRSMRRVSPGPSTA